MDAIAKTDPEATLRREIAAHFNVDFYDVLMRADHVFINRADLGKIMRADLPTILAEG